MDIADITGAWDYSSLPSNIRLGKDCFLERRSSLDRFRSLCRPGLVLGDRVRVLTWTTFSIEQEGVVTIGDDTLLIGATLMCEELIEIGAECTISYNVSISDCDFHPVDLEFRRRDAIAVSPAGRRSDRPPLRPKPVTIGRGVMIGAGAMILKGVNIGDGATIAPGAVVSRSVPANSLAAGNPATNSEPT
jgi:acetyltransferase-like isoleucine patch superfamily enzyme